MRNVLLNVLDNLEQLNLSENELISIDIDTHIINYNDLLDVVFFCRFEEIMKI